MRFSSSLMHAGIAALALIPAAALGFFHNAECEDYLAACTVYDVASTVMRGADNGAANGAAAASVYSDAIKVAEAAGRSRTERDR